MAHQELENAAFDEGPRIAERDWHMDTREGWGIGQPSGTGRQSQI